MKTRIFLTATLGLSIAAILGGCDSTGRPLYGPSSMSGGTAGTGSAASPTANTAGTSSGGIGATGEGSPGSRTTGPGVGGPSGAPDPKK